MAGQATQGRRTLPFDDGIPAGTGRQVTLDDMAIMRLFASAREVAGRGRDEIPGATVAEVLATATERYGTGFAAVLDSCRVWVNGEAVPHDTQVGPDDEVAVLPPVSGGADGTADAATTTTTSEEPCRG